MNLLKVGEHIINLDNVARITTLDEGVIKIIFINDTYIELHGKNYCEYVLSYMKKHLGGQ